MSSAAKQQSADDLAARYRSDGYAIVRGLFRPDEVAAIGEAVDRLHAEAVAHGRSFRHGNLFYRMAAGEQGGDPVVQMVQWPAYHMPELDRVRRDPRWAALLAPLIGGDIKQIINQLHWKKPGSKGDFAWHQDSQFRQPTACYRNLSDAYVQTGLAIDPHTRESGCLRFIPRSHLKGELALDYSSDVLGRSMDDAALAAVGLSAKDVVDVLLEPGDVALWNSYMVHGSGTNRSDHQRRLFINGYVRAQDCDRGEWAFRNGEPVPLGPEPVLVHYEDLHERPGPHYV